MVQAPDLETVEKLNISSDTFEELSSYQKVTGGPEEKPQDAL